MPRIRIEGSIDVGEETSHEEFLDLFLEWIAEQEWEFDGKTAVISDEDDA